MSTDTGLKNKEKMIPEVNFLDRTDRSEDAIDENEAVQSPEATVATVNETNNIDFTSKASATEVKKG